MGRPLLRGFVLVLAIAAIYLLIPKSGKFFSPVGRYKKIQQSIPFHADPQKDHAVAQKFPGTAVDESSAAVPTLSEQSQTSGGRNTIVVGSFAADDTSWVGKYLPEWDNAIYVLDNKSHPLKVPANKGAQAMAYLTYVIDHYAKLPEIVVFLHAEQKGLWFTDNKDNDLVISVSAMKLEHIKKEGYANLRCTWNPGCPDEVQPFRNDPWKTTEHHIAQAWSDVFGVSVGSVPKVIGGACGGQFAVSGSRIRERSLEGYVKIRDWLLKTDFDDETSLRILDYFWHAIFKMGPQYCPEERKCRCDLYGVC